MKKIILSLIIITFLLPETNGFAQEALKSRPSPFAVSTLKVDDTYIKITYGRPHKRDREIFGDLVTYGEVWRTGANEATEITLTGPVKMGDVEVKPGTYTLFTIPGEEEWTIILNSDLGQWGAYRYNEDANVATFKVPVTQVSDVYEPFTIEFATKEKKTNLNLIWDQTMVTVPFEVL
jgi:hypothetical protein